MTQSANLAALGSNASSTGTLGASSFASATIPNSALSGNPTFRNRIINGGMVISQRNGTSSVSISNPGVYTIDRFKSENNTDGTLTAQQSSTAPAGFINSLLFTVGTADSSLASTQYAIYEQRVEGLNITDFGWGTANAQTVTLSFWVRSSVTGTYGGSIVNSDFNRTYPFTYSISAANTWEQKSITIPGDTSGTWLTTNGIGLIIRWGFGVGSTYSAAAGSWTAGGYLSATGATNMMATSGATYYVTGVQLEAGSAASPFENRLIGTELALCQRYYFSSSRNASNDVIFPYLNGNNLTARASFASQMRTTPTVTIYSGATPNVVSQVGGSNQAVSGVGGVSETGFRTINGSTFSSSPYAFFEFNYNASAEL